MLTSQKQFGLGYGINEEQKPGSMAVFCALCAQPGINLLENWREYKNRYVNRCLHLLPANIYSSKILFMQGFMMDGNFQAEHMKMRNPENDVPLSKGTGFMVSQKSYELHLQSAFERWQVCSVLVFIQGEFMLEKISTCHDHHAVNDVNKHGGHLESTGISATACIHRAFVPDSVIDFQKGEA